MLKLRLLILALLAFAGFWGFVEIADEVLEGSTHRFDSEIMMALRQPQDPNTPIGPRWLQEVARDITSLGGTTVLTLLTLATVGYLIPIHQRAAAALDDRLQLAAARSFSTLLKSGFDRPRSRPRAPRGRSLFSEFSERARDARDGHLPGRSAHWHARVQTESASAGLSCCGRSP